MEAKICRTCLQNTGTVSIFDKQDDIALLSSKIMRCVNVNIEEHDGFPDRICTTCESELAICYNFISKCEASDKCLRDNHLMYAIAPERSDKTLDVTFKTEIEDYEPNIQAAEFLSSDEDVKQYVLILKDETDSKCEKPKRKNGKRKGKVKCKKLTAIDCNECGLNMPSVAALEIHRRTHSGEKPFSCGKCGKCFSRKDNYLRHTLRHEAGRCRKVYTRKIKREKQGPIQCVVCGLLVNSQSAMIIHSRSHTGERPFACSHCNKSYSAKGCLKRHIETNHSADTRERKFTCETCGRSFYRKSEIIIHIRTHTGEKPYECPYCSMRFLQISSLTRHKRTHTGDKPFGCPTCGKQFADRSLLKKHLYVHTDERKFKCHLCPKSMKTHNSLKSHLRLHNNEKNNVCNFCGLAFSAKGNLKTHMVRVHSEKSGQCALCLKTFSNLEIHMRKHTGEKPFVCSMCDRAFASKVSLMTHLAFKHNADKYKCTIGDCARTFPIPSMLEFHLLKQHTNHTPHVCQHCSRGFFRASDLSRHLRVSHMETVLVKVKPPVD